MASMTVRWELILAWSHSWNCIELIQCYIWLTRFHIKWNIHMAVNNSNIQRRETNQRRSIMHLLTELCSNPGCLSEHVRRWARGTARTWCQLGRYAVIVICIRKVKHTMESMFKICGPSLWVCQNKIIADRNPRAKRKQQSTMGKKTLVVRKSSVLRSTPTCKPVWNFAFQAPKHFGGKLHGPSDLYTQRPKGHASCRLVLVVHVELSRCAVQDVDMLNCQVVHLTGWSSCRAVGSIPK